VSGTEKLKNWTGVGNDRFGELDGNFWLTMSDRFRCIPDLRLYRVDDCNASLADRQYPAMGAAYEVPKAVTDRLGSLTSL
jgi:hypothetical protein